MEPKTNIDVFRLYQDMFRGTRYKVRKGRIILFDKFSKGWVSSRHNQSSLKKYFIGALNDA